MHGSSVGTDIENRLMDTSREEEGQGEMNGESSMEAYTLTYAKQVARGNLVYDWEPKLGLCHKLEG